MTIEIPDVLFDNNEQKKQITIDLACFLFEKNIFSLGKAAEFANIPQVEMQWILGDRNIPIHYDVADFLEDIKTLEQLHLNDSSK